MMQGLIAFEGTLQELNALAGELLLPRGEGAVQRKKEIHESGGKVTSRIKLRRRAADGIDENGGFR